MKSNQHPNQQSNQPANQQSQANQKQSMAAGQGASVSDMPLTSGRQSPRASESRSSEGLPDMINRSLPPESREHVERLMRDAQTAVRDVRSYARQNPGEAIGLACTAGAVLWALLGTKPGRRVLESGSAIAMPYVSQWVSRNFKEFH